jgi:hypothetical protein
MAFKKLFPFRNSPKTRKQNTMKTKITFAALLMIPLLFTGCASIMDGGAKPVTVDSNPEGAKVTISNQNGDQVGVQTTPATVTLERGAGYFRGADYTLRIEKDGYYPYEAHVESTLDGWYIGNIFFGGLIGEIAIDPMTGDMWTLSPRKVNVSLVPLNAAPAAGTPAQH